jgi:hypothetical protein
MPRVAAEHLKPGMVVARDVKNIDGMLLVPSGCALTERQVGILQAWGVTEAEVEAGADVPVSCSPLEALPPDVLARMTAELKGRFWRLDEASPVQMEIFNQALLRQARRTLSL